jgi:hypothetical protein
VPIAAVPIAAAMPITAAMPIAAPLPATTGIAAAAVPATAGIAAAAVPATAGIAAGVRATPLRTTVHLRTGHTNAADQAHGGKQNYCKSFHDILLRRLLLD